MIVYIGDIGIMYFASNQVYAGICMNVQVYACLCKLYAYISVCVYDSVIV